MTHVGPGRPGSELQSRKYLTLFWSTDRSPSKRRADQPAVVDGECSTMSGVLKAEVLGREMFLLNILAIYNPNTSESKRVDQGCGMLTKFAGASALMLPQSNAVDERFKGASDHRTSASQQHQIFSSEMLFADTKIYLEVFLEA